MFVVRVPLFVLTLLLLQACGGPARPVDALVSDGTLSAAAQLGKAVFHDVTLSASGRMSCASCHDLMDPVGFALENFDAIGKWREKDGSFAIDAKGTLPDGRSFASPSEMRGVLVSKLPQFSRTLTEKMMIYALGRGLKDSDARFVDGINDTVARDGYRVQTLIRQIVASLPFQSSHAEVVTGAKP